LRYDTPKIFKKNYSFQKFKNEYNRCPCIDSWLNGKRQAHSFPMIVEEEETKLYFPMIVEEE